MTIESRKAKAEKAIRACIYSELAALARDTGCVPYGLMVDTVRVEGLNSSVPEFDYRIHIRIAETAELEGSVKYGDGFRFP